MACARHRRRQVLPIVTDEVLRKSFRGCSRLARLVCQVPHSLNCFSGRDRLQFVSGLIRNGLVPSGAAWLSPLTCPYCSNDHILGKGFLLRPPGALDARSVHASNFPLAYRAERVYCTLGYRDELLSVTEVRREQTFRSCTRHPRPAPAENPRPRAHERVRRQPSPQTSLR